jgi:hypothetical protein
MTDPIAGGSSRKLESSYDDAVCREEEPKPPTASHEDVVAKLPTRAFDYSLMARPEKKAEPAPTGPTNTNAERTTARAGVAPYAAAGVTSSGDSEFVGAALLKGRNSKSGIETEVLSASVQRGFQNEAQVGLIRVGASRDDGTTSGTVDALTARAAFGIHNPDGSTGLNIALSATALGIEGAHRENGSSIGGGLGLGVGGEASVGLRDSDHDGKPELCVRIGAGPILANKCIERPW